MAYDLAPNHPLRAALSAEMHVRRLPRFASPCRLMQVVAIYQGEAAAHRDHLAQIAEPRGVAVPDGARHTIVPLGDGTTLVWEGHSEFATWTFIHEGAFTDPFDPAIFGNETAIIAAALPGEVIRATQVAVAAPDWPEPRRALLEELFEATALVVCDVADGHARVASDFTLHSDGFGRLLVLDRGLDGDETGQLVVRLQELGNYRNMALLGLPVAQESTRELSVLEQRLSALTHEISERTASDEHLLDELTFVSAELARLAATTRYRMSATRAYADLSLERLRSLNIAPVRGYQTLSDFTERRLVPAVRTCESFLRRLDDLSQRAAWTSELLRTRIDIALATQNRDLLASMDKRTQVQLRLQQTVEGLSVVAISYYLVALIGYLAKPFGAHDYELVTAIAAPVVVLIVWLGLIRVKRRLHD